MCEESCLYSQVNTLTLSAISISNLSPSNRAPGELLRTGARPELPRGVVCGARGGLPAAAAGAAEPSGGEISPTHQAPARSPFIHSVGRYRKMRALRAARPAISLSLYYYCVSMCTQGLRSFARRRASAARRRKGRVPRDRATLGGDTEIRVRRLHQVRQCTPREECLRPRRHRAPLASRLPLLHCSRQRRAPSRRHTTLSRLHARF